MRVALFVPCFVDRFAPQVAEATVRVLRRLDVAVDYFPRQTCCGQPAFNAGRIDEARAVAEHFVRVFSKAETVVAPSGSCVAMVRHRYPALFTGHPLEADAVALSQRVYELSQYLVDVLGVDRLGASFPGRAVFHDACHALRELGVSEQPRRLLANVRGLVVSENSSRGSCCGFGGLFSTGFAGISTAMADEKLQEALEARADVIISGEQSCLLHLEGRIRRRRLRLRTVHLSEVLAASEVAP